MNIAFIHYHLKLGGVTTVLTQQINVIRDTCSTLVLSGEPPVQPFPVEVVHIPQLSYSSLYKGSVDPVLVAEKILKTLIQKWPGQECDVLHIHNPGLAKNRYFQKIIRILQQKGVTLFLQIHDFAEDGRPALYFQNAYPSDCHYGVINSRDYRILRKAGLKKTGVHKIHNMIHTPSLTVRKTETPATDFVLYPIRAIRRKNIGEAILLSLFFKDNEILVLTLPPNSRNDIRSYTDWKQFVRNNRLKVIFDAGLSYSYPSLLTSANYFITTSITEGFGFSFLEPWLAGKSVWGRKLPDVCGDFEENGIDLNHLYDRLQIPIHWVDGKKLQKRWTETVLDVLNQFNFKIDKPTIANAFEKITRNRLVDFGILDEPLQKIVMLRVLFKEKERHELIDANPFLFNPFTCPRDHLIEENNAAIRKQYNPQRYQKTLLDIYKKVITTPVVQRIDKSVLINEFLDLEKFSLLKWGHYVS